MPDLPDQLRAASAAVAVQAAHVTIVDDAIEPYAASLSGDLSRAAGTIDRAPDRPAREATCAHVLTLDAINFGSGWFPTLRKRPGLSGYRTIAAGLAERIEHLGPWTAGQLRRITPGELALVLGQDPGHELIGLFRKSLNDLGARVEDGYGARFAAVVDAAHDSAVSLAGTLAGWDSFADVSHYRGLRLPFYKRAQIAAADLHRAGVADFSADLHRLTIFADNLVPHVLTLDGVLRLSPELAGAIAREELIPHGSEPEVELRACAVDAVERLVGALRAAGTETSAAALDTLLWERGGGARYKAHPRPRSRTTAY